MSWSFIPAIHVATLQQSKRATRLKADLLRMGITDYIPNEQIPPLNKTFENITMSCSDNHLQIYRKAIAGGLPFICVLEDDVFIPDDQLGQVPVLLAEIQQFLSLEKDWDFLYLGHFPWKLGKQITAHIYQSISWCTHAYLISQRGMQFMLKYTPAFMLETGRIAVPYLFDLCFKEAGGIDTFIAYHTHLGNLKSFALKPFLVHQYSIPHWSRKAQIAELLSGLGGFWPKQVMLFGWVMCWLLLLLIMTRRAGHSS